MANLFSPFGFSPIGTADGVASNFAHINRPVSNSSSSAIFKGDPVKQLSTGYVAQWTPAAGISQLIGIFWGCTYPNPQSQSGVTRSPYWPGSGSGSGDATAQIIPIMFGAVPQQFLVQTGNSAGGATPFGATDVGKNIDVALGSGNTNNGSSTAYADQNTEGTSSTLPFRIIALWTGGILNPNVFSPFGGTGNGSDLTTANNFIIVQSNNFQATGI